MFCSSCAAILLSTRSARALRFGSSRARAAVRDARRRSLSRSPRRRSASARCVERADTWEAPPAAAAPEQALRKFAFAYGAIVLLGVGLAVASEYL